MSVRIGDRGQVVIPKSVRDQAGLHAGDRVDVEFRGGEVVLVRADRTMRPLGGRYEGGPGLAEQLLADRRREPR